MAKKHQHAVWVVTTKSFEDGSKKTEFSPRMGYAKEQAYLRAHGLIKENTMPLKYNPDTGIPSYVPDLGEELEEGVTPEPKVIHSKADVFRGDKKLTAEQYEKLRGNEDEHLGTVNISTEHADKLLADALKSAKPAKLDKDVATDEEVNHLERLANEHEVQNWPMLLRLINRLRRAES